MKVKVKIITFSFERWGSMQGPGSGHYVLLIFEITACIITAFDTIHRGAPLNSVMLYRIVADFQIENISSSYSILLAEIFPFEISSGVPQLPMPFVMAEPEVIGGIILGISILYIAMRLGLLNIFCSVPIFPT